MNGFTCLNTQHFQDWLALIFCYGNISLRRRDMITTMINMLDADVRTIFPRMFVISTLSAIDLFLCGRSLQGS